MLAAWLFHRKMISVHQIYTFGGPMVGNADAAQAINREFKGKVFRFVNVPDPVPRLPMMSLIANRVLPLRPGDGGVGRPAARDAGICRAINEVRRAAISWILR